MGVSLPAGTRSSFAHRTEWMRFGFPEVSGEGPPAQFSWTKIEVQLREIRWSRSANTPATRCQAPTISIGLPRFAGQPGLPAPGKQEERNAAVWFESP